MRLNVVLSNRELPTAFEKLQQVAANCRIRVAGRAKFRTRQELQRSERPISHQFATRPAPERELYVRVPTFLNNTGKTYSPKRSYQVVNVRGVYNCVLIIAGSSSNQSRLPNSESKLARRYRLAKSVLKAISFFGPVLDRVVVWKTGTSSGSRCGLENRDNVKILSHVRRRRMTKI